MTIELSASYRLIDELHASVVLESDQRPGIVLSVLHERYACEAVCYDFAGHDEHQIHVVAGESLTIIVRCQGHIIGALVNEVDCREGSRLLLHPKGGYNLIVYQSRLDDLPQNAYSDEVGTLHEEPTPTTLRLAETLEIVNQRYSGHRVPHGLIEFLPIICDALVINEEDHSQQMAHLFRQAIEGLALDIEAKIQAALQIGRAHV